MSIKAGDIVPYLLQWESVSGTPRTGKVVGDLTFTAHDSSGTVIIGTTLTELSGGLYRLDVTMPGTTGAISIKLTPDVADDVLSFSYINENIEQNDNDSLFSAFAGTATTGPQDPITADDVQLEDAVENDTYVSPTLIVPQNLLDRHGYASMAAFDDSDITAQVKTSPTDSSVAIVAEWVSAAANTFRFRWPAGTFAIAGNVRSQELFVDVQLIDTTPTPDVRLTIGRAVVTNKWERNELTS